MGGTGCRGSLRGVILSAGLVFSGLTWAEEEPAEPAIAVKGRILARALADERVEFDRQLGIAQARLGLKGSLPWVDAVLEADLSSSQLLKDAYIRLHDGSKRFRLYGGRFKAPFLARELESSWDLPLLRRGLLDDFLVDEHRLGGRRFGLMVQTRLKPALGLKASAGIFQGAFDDQARKHMGEDASARMTFEPLRFLTVGTSAYLAEVGRSPRRFAVSSDLTVKLAKVRVTAEGTTGRIVLGRFWGATALVTYDFGLSGKWILQPVFGAEGLKLHTAEGDGFAHAGSAGLNVLYDERMKVMVHAERAFRPGDVRPFHELGLQLGARF